MDIQLIIFLLIAIIVAVVVGNIISNIIIKKNSLNKNDITEEINKIGQSLYNEMHKHFAKRLTSIDNEKWETFASFYKECDDHREKYKDDENKLKILEGYNNYVEEMEKKFENA